MSSTGRQYGYEYFVVRCVPRVDREEFMNVGVVVYSHEAGYLGALTEADPARLLVFAPELDLQAVNDALTFVEAVCAGTATAGPAGDGSGRSRFGWLAAPRSTVVQPGPVHGGITDDPERELAHLFARLVAR